MPSAGYAVTNTFISDSGNVSASTLDVNFSQPATALNSLLTFSNYFVDTGSANVMQITVPTPLVAALTAGLMFYVKVANTNNTQGTTLAVNGGAAQQIVYPPLLAGAFGGTAKVIPGQLLAGSVVPLIYDGTNFQYLGQIFGSGSFTGTLSGFSGAAVTLTVQWRISTTTASVYMQGNIAGTSNLNSMTLTGNPTCIVPASPQIVAVPDGMLLDNGASLTVASGAAGLAFVQTSGALIIFAKNYNTTGFTATGSKGISAGNSWSLSYPLN